jgi:hypothetical protein
LLAKQLKIGDATVARAWREYGVAPWRCETFKRAGKVNIEQRV